MEHQIAGPQLIDEAEDLSEQRSWDPRTSYVRYELRQLPRPGPIRPPLLQDYGRIGPSDQIRSD